MKPGPKPKGQVRIQWSPEFAYAIGLIVADGCLSKDERHIDFTSKDVDLIETFKTCLGLSTKTAVKLSGTGAPYHHTQFGDVLFYRFLETIGLSPAKSNIIQAVAVPEEYFLDFFRGYFDGDGSSYSGYDPWFPKSFRFHLSFVSGSKKYIEWLRATLFRILKVKGYTGTCFKEERPFFQLKYSKREAIVIVQKMYYREGLPCLQRKYLKIQRSLGIIASAPSRSGEIGRRAAFRAQ